jgi:glutamyl-tRNA reductase
LLEEQIKFENWLKSMVIVPTIKNLQTHAEDIRKSEADKVLKKLEDKLTDKELDMILTMSTRIKNKLIHDPIMELKKSALNDETRDITNQTVRKLYKLEDD